MQEPKFHCVEGIDIAYHSFSGASPSFVWLGGYRSDMDGSKAIALEKMACTHGYGSLRFDYSGHGKSSGAFLDGAISIWANQARAMIDEYTDGPQILVGSSMGAWIALLLVKALNKGTMDDKIAGLLLLAPAPDFTSALMEPDLTDAQRAELDAKGYFEEPTPYGPEPNRFTKKLFDDGRNQQVMTGPIDTFCPVHIIQGKADPDVPWQHAQRLFELLSKDDASLAFVTDGDHRLSREADLAMIERAALSLAKRIG